MRKRPYVPQEITLVAFARHPDGTLSIQDIVETSFHYASHFARRFYRDRDVYAVDWLRPGRPFNPRPIIRS